MKKTYKELFPLVNQREWKLLEKGFGEYDPKLYKEIEEEIESRIRKFRTKEINIKICDGHGKGIPYLEVEICQLKNDFPFGNVAGRIQEYYRNGKGDSAEAEVLKEKFKAIFNSATVTCYWVEYHAGPALSTEILQGYHFYESFAKTVEWAAGAGLNVKGHPLVWTVPKAVPEWVRYYDDKTIMKFLEVRVRNLVRRYKGIVKIWDVVNEPMWETTFSNLQNRQWPHMEDIRRIADYIEPVICWCREEDPEAFLLINDYGMELDKFDINGEELKGNDGSIVTAARQRQRFIELIEELKARGTPPDGIGLQSRSGWIPPDVQWKIYDEFAVTGLPLHITEFNGINGDDEKEADYIRNYMRVAFAHPSVTGFFFWGSGALSERGMFNEQPVVFHTLYKLLNEEWKSNIKMVTDKDGIIRFTGFIGEYTLRYRLSNNRCIKGERFKVDKNCDGLIILKVT